MLAALTELVRDAETARFRAFARDFLPFVARAAACTLRLCCYCDTPSGDFVVARDVRDARVTVAGGGSGHALKFAPLLGELAAHTVAGAPPADPLLAAAHARFGRLAERLHAQSDAQVGAQVGAQADVSRSMAHVSGERAALVAQAIAVAEARRAHAQ